MSERASGRMFPFPLLTFRGFVVLLAGGLVPLVGLLVDISLENMLKNLFLLLAVYVFFLIRDALRVRRFLRRLTLVPSLSTVLYSGVPSTFSLNLTGRKVPFSGTLQLRPLVPLELSATPEILSTELKHGELACVLAQTLMPVARGSRKIRELYGRVALRGGLARWQFRLPLEPELVTTVYPNPGVNEMKDFRAFQKLTEGDTLTDVQGLSGREIDSLRLYNVGDDLRKVDWKRSARGRGLLVKVYRPETHQRLTIAIDCGRRMGNRVMDRLQIEYASDAAAQLLRIANQNEDEIGLFAFNHKVLAKIPCRRGRRQERVLAEVLVDLQVGALEADYQLLTEWAQANRRRSLMVLITSISNPASFDSVRAALMPVRKIHLPLVFALADRDLRNLVAQKAANVTDAYMIGAGMVELARIHARAAQISKGGMECIYCDVSDLGRMLRHKYYELKRSGRL